MNLMNDLKKQAVIDHMIEFIEDKEKELQSSALEHEHNLRSTIVKAILDELDREVANED